MLDVASFCGRTFLETKCATSLCAGRYPVTHLARSQQESQGQHHGSNISVHAVYVSVCALFGEGRGLVLVGLSPRRLLP